MGIQMALGVFIIGIYTLLAIITVGSLICSYLKADKTDRGDLWMMAIISLLQGLIFIV